MPRFELTVNGERRVVETDGSTPLLWVLRDSLNLTGTKYGCGEGLCGACTVLEGRRTFRSCQLSLADSAGRTFTTIEGLSQDGDHPVQRAWLGESVSQCGYCQPGMILEIAALTAGGRRPSADEIDRALADHVCRCGTYPRLRRAALAVAGGKP